jgi:hypothetical protein
MVSYYGSVVRNQPCEMLRVEPLEISPISGEQPATNGAHRICWRTGLVRFRLETVK